MPSPACPTGMITRLPRDEMPVAGVDQGCPVEGRTRFGATLRSSWERASTGVMTLRRGTAEGNLSPRSRSRPGDEPTHRGAGPWGR